MQTTQIISGLVGTALAGFLISLAQSGWPAFALDSASFFFSAACLGGIRAHGMPERLPETGQGMLRELRRELWEGLRLIGRTRALHAILTAFAVACLGMGAVSVLFVPFLVNTLHVPAAAVALAKGAQIGGLLLGGAWAARRAAARSSALLIGGGLAGIGVATVLLGWAPNLGFVLASLFLLGSCATPMQSATNALLQRRTPNVLLGRVEGAVDTLLTAAMMASMAAAGILAERIGIRGVFSVAGLLCLAGGLLGWAMLARAAPIAENPVQEV
jgi:MFS family permease